MVGQGLRPFHGGIRVRYVRTISFLEVTQVPAEGNGLENQSGDGQKRAWVESHILTVENSITWMEQLARPGSLTQVVRFQILLCKAR